MSVDTNVKGKNLAPYRRVPHPEFKVLIAPQLVGMAQQMQLDTTGGFRKKFTVNFDSGEPASCDIGGCN